MLVFAIARPEGDYQTAELLLGKFDIQKDEEGTSFRGAGLRREGAGSHRRPIGHGANRERHRSRERGLRPGSSP